MNDNIQDNLEDDLREEYDLSQLKNPVRGKYYEQYREGHNVTIHYEDGTKKIEHFPPQNEVIILDPDVKKYFPNSESVNATLRSLIKLIPQQ
ncbi:hypothetical protein [Aphanothece sacrum]|uniref:Uncharacterized protein n=1 Tax=Aphanothece sacrum FPU1 TaxID=1920663 RepID=A0A401IEG6_APHSA|nr:hypothetical protein [Aphanothece sacrum]GBF79663.1 hypothetical protein AsFPU1_1062 [Aphanothece sacrum FPU1]GBF87123.1 hypothetical protein AsFPU3_4205 [Aphanothece sacrum FPU3]